MNPDFYIISYDNPIIGENTCGKECHSSSPSFPGNMITRTGSFKINTVYTIQRLYALP
jgi:hypothetical protein